MLAARVRLLSATRARKFRAAQPPKEEASPLAADHSSSALSIYHKVNWALLALTPAAFLLSPSVLNTPIDLALSLAFPYHAWVGMNCVLTDYVPKFLGKGALGPSRVAMAGVTAVTAAGLLKCTLTGPGITETIKRLWRKDE